MNKWFNKKFFLISIILFITVLYFLNINKPHVKNKIGSPAPNFSLKDIDGKTITLAGMKGNVILLEFFATWCPPCKDSIPHINSLNEKYKDKGLLVYGINLDSGVNASDIKQFAKDNNVQYDILISDDKTGRLYNINSIPVTFIIDKQLNITNVYVGFSQNLEGIIDKEIGTLL